MKNNSNRVKTRVGLGESGSSFYVRVAGRDGQIDAGLVKGASAAALRSERWTEQGGAFGVWGLRHRAWSVGAEPALVGSGLLAGVRKRRWGALGSARARLGAGRISAVGLRVHRSAGEERKAVMLLPGWEKRLGVFFLLAENSKRKLEQRVW